MVSASAQNDAPASMRLLPLAVAAARAPAALLREGRGRRDRAARFSGRDIKLEEDTAAEAAIRAVLTAESDLPILGEEGGWAGGAEARGEHWVVDPLDGSFNYHRGVPLYAVSVALCHGRTPLLGVIYDPEREEVFAGGPGIGAWLNGESIVRGAPQRQLAATGVPSGAGFEASVEKMRALGTDYTKLRLLGSAALSLAWVAAGRLDAYAEHGIMWWDVAAGLALVAGAGIRDIACEPLGGHAVHARVAA